MNVHDQQRVTMVTPMTARTLARLPRHEFARIRRRLDRQLDVLVRLLVATLAARRRLLARDARRRRLGAARGGAR